MIRMSSRFHCFVLLVGCCFLLAGCFTFLPFIDEEETGPIQLEPLAKVQLGPGWASTSVNTVIFRHHGIVTRDSYQFAAYYDDHSNMAFVRRDLQSNKVEAHAIEGKYNTRDAHNSISLGIDADGYIHASYDHHGHPLRYRRSKRPLQIGEWTEAIPMTGEYEDKVTYPYFVMCPRKSDGFPGLGDLLFMYRLGSSGNGDICIKKYEPQNQSWEDHAPRFIKGMEQKPWTANAYWNHPAFDSKGNMHLSWVWRVNKGGPPELVNNHHVGYTWTPDYGQTCMTSRGLPLSTPLTPVNCESIWSIPPGSNLINQCSSAMDSHDRLHIVFYADDLDGIPQYQHLWFNGHVWQCDVITSRTTDFELSGKGTLRIPISRPEIVIDHADRVYVIYRGDLTGDCMVSQRLDPPHYAPPGKTVVLWNENLDHSEPVIDRIRWERDGILSMLIQKNHQPNHDRSEDVSPETVWIADWDLDF